MATRIRRIPTAESTRQQDLEHLLQLQDALLRNRKGLLRQSRPSGVTDSEERSVDAEEEGVGFSLLELTSKTVQGIEMALQRLDAGAFGKCSDCRGAIGDERLRALPFAARCLACQQKHDLAAVASASEARASWEERGALTRIASIGL